MTTARRLRRVAPVAAAGLLGALLPVVAGSPATAADACTTEERPSILDPGCDDVTPPETRVSATTPAPNAAGFINVTSVEFTVVGTHTDSDRDPVVFQCQWYSTATAPEGWESCGTDLQADPLTGTTTATVRHADVADSGSDPWTLRVRAVDAADRDRTWADPNPLDPRTETVLDFDASPAVRELKVDTRAPGAPAIIGLPYDELRPDLPMVTDRSPVVTISTAGERGATLRCTVNDAKVPCQAGETELPDLKPGDQVLQARVVDAAGNVGKARTERFSVPRNLTTRARGWSRLTKAGHFSGDYVEATRRGAEFAVRARNFREVRLIAPLGPTAGKLEVKMGRQRWKPVKLRAKEYRKLGVLQLRDEFAPPMSGQIRFRVVSQGARVQLDAILVH